MTEHSFDVVDPKLDDKDLTRVGQAVLEEAKAGAIRVAKEHSLPDDETSFEHIMKERLDAAEPFVRAQAVGKLTQIADNPTLRKQELGSRFVNIDLENRNIVADAKLDHQTIGGIRRYEELLRREDVGTNHPFDPVVRDWHPNPTDFEPRQEYRFNGVSFMLDKVYCVDETGWDWSGSDEISLGGITVDEDGEVGQIGPFSVSNDFDTGEWRNYSPDRRVNYFNVREGGEKWPKVYTAHIVMVERDWGDFPQWLQTLYNKATEKIEEYIETYVSSLTGPVIARWVKAVANWFFDKALTWIRGIWEDDVIDNHTFQLTHAGPQASFGGSANSSTTIRNYYGGGGKYRTWTYWNFE
ncbi:hypothetical protein [Haloarcula sp. 1CSR25-25]|uniref:hypothetical protein n=1 Tax=Haloarcula sp. 1CSR25-25 TaxID=2862545 RepID=UPI002894C8DE|nr:hypothetical protein [Haloarcula sp. 1CSR25-25]MDT3435994.1 hypothetical protein [Haloarcula sp. 1CSR25-25]